MDKEVAVYIHNGILLSHKKERIGVSSNEVDDLEPIIQSEVSQKVKDKYYILMHIFGIQENDTEEYIYRATMEKQTYGHGERGGEGEMYGKSNMETYIIICKVYSQWEFAVWLRKLKQGLCINLEGWDREGDGREVQRRGDICTFMVDSHWGLTENKIL